MDENQSLIASSNDNVGKQKKAFVFPVVTAFSTILLLVLVFSGGKYWDSHRVRDDALIQIDRAMFDDELLPTLDDELLPTGSRHRARDDALIPIDGWCYDHPNNCITPPDLSQPAFCFCSSSDHKACWCQSGQPGEYCDETSDCVIPKGLDHSVCRFGGGDAQCQSGRPGALCGQTSDCVVQTGLNHPVCREDKCQSGQPGALCGQTSDCVVQTRLDPPHAVCRNGKCQR